MKTLKEYTQMNEAVDKSLYLDKDLKSTIIRLRQNYVKDLIDSLESIVKGGTIRNDSEQSWLKEISNATKQQRELEYYYDYIEKMNEYEKHPNEDLAREIKLKNIKYLKDVGYWK